MIVKLHCTKCKAGLWDNESYDWREYLGGAYWAFTDEESIDTSGMTCECPEDDETASSNWEYEKIPDGYRLLIDPSTFDAFVVPITPESLTIRFWDDWGDGDATAEGELEQNFVAHAAGGGPQYKGFVTDLNGKKTYVTIN